mmetsp:Transcript_3854/g.5944  ORF Transcript_3854/g.5944 Transcript_3854/m.5944 type:complete len:181 (+) Transcript_3854:86-628(+)
MGRRPLPEVEESRVACLYCDTDLLKYVSEFLNEALPQAGFKESHMWGNIRMLVCFIGCAIATYGHFGCKFPTESIKMGCCALGYFAFSGLTTLVDWLVIKSSAIAVLDPAGGPVIFVDVNLPKFTTTMTMTFRSSAATVSVSRDVGHYFGTCTEGGKPAGGYCSHQAVWDDTMQLYDDYR